jgi:beta-glucanase (GH16 family)
VTDRFTLSGDGFDQGFHIFAIEWDVDRITWIVDDIRYNTVTSGDLPQGGRWVFNHPFFVVLNVAVGGRFVGSPDESTTFPQTMFVDYVRVYRGER